MSLFSEKRIEQYLAENEAQAIARIDATVLPAEDKAAEFAQRLADDNKLGTVSIEPKDAQTEVIIEQIHSSRIDPFRFPEPGKSYPHAAVLFKVPVEGNTFLLGCAPRTYSNNSSSAVISGKTLVLKIQTQFANENLSAEVEESVKRNAVSEIDRIQTNIGYLNAEVEAYNQSLYGSLYAIIQEKIAAAKAKKERENRLNPFA